MAIALVQQTTAALTAVASQNITIPATGVGNFLLIEVSEAAASTASIWTPTAAGATFVAPTAGTVTNGPPPVGWSSGVNSFTSFGYAHNVPAGITTVTIAMAGTAKAGFISITEWSGVATATAVEASTGAAAASATTQTTVALGALTAGDVVVGAVSNPTTSNASFTLNQAISFPTTGWLGLTGSGTNIRVGMAYQIMTGAVTGAKVGWTLATATASGVCAIALKQAVAGTAWTVNPADSLTLNDAATTSQGFGILPADTVTLADAATTSRGINLLPTEAVALADAISTAAQFHIAFSDSVALADAVTPSLGLNLSFSEAVALADNIAKSQGFALSFADSVTLADTTSESEGFSIVASDSIVLADSIVIARDIQLQFSDAATLQDTLITSEDFSRTLADTILLVDAAAASLGLNLSPADTLALADNITVGLGRALTQGVDDVLALADDIVLALGKALSQTVDDSLILADAIDIAQGFARTFSDSLAVSDFVTVDVQEFAHFQLYLHDGIIVTDRVTLSPTKYEWDRVFGKYLLRARNPQPGAHGRTSL